MSTLESKEKPDLVHEDRLEEVSANENPFDYEKLDYGKNGIAGMVASPYVFGAALLASMGGFSFGYDQGVISLILTMPEFWKVFPEIGPDYSNSGFYVGLMTAMLQLGSFLGCLAYPVFADRFSRKWGLTAAVVWFCAGAILQVAAVDYGMLVAGRTIGGVGVGTLALGAPMYISEIAPPNLRGSLLVLEALSIVVGAIISYWITYGTQNMAGSWAFRLPFLLQMPPAILVGTCIHFFPFSPRWLAMRDRFNDALQSLSKLRRLPKSDRRIQTEYRGICAEVRLEREVLRKRHGDNNSTIVLEVKAWADLFSKRYRRRTMVAMAVPFFQQFSGINAFVYYAPILFTALGQDKHMALILAGMINIDQLVGAIITIIYLDRVGRRKLAIWGGVAMAIPHTILAGLVGAFNNSWPFHNGPAWFAVALVYIYVLNFAITYGPLGWTVPAEVFPSAVRAKGVALAVATNWVANFIIGLTVPPMIDGIGFGTYIFFACFCSLAALFAYFFQPETSNLTLEQIDNLFDDHAGQDAKIIRDAVAEDFRRGSVTLTRAEDGLHPLV